MLLSHHSSVTVHGKRMRIVYNDKQSTFEELLERDKSVTIHHSNIRKLVRWHVSAK